MSNDANRRVPVQTGLPSSPPADHGRPSTVGNGRVDIEGIPQRASNWFDQLACHPDLTKAFRHLGGRVLDGTLSSADREVLILRTAWLNRCEYEWRHHVSAALAAGVSVDEVAAIGRDEPGPLSRRRRIMVDAADQLNDRCLIEAATWTDLSAVLDEQQLLEVMFVVGFYRMVAGAMKSLNIASEDQYLHLELPVGW